MRGSDILVAWFYDCAIYGRWNFYYCRLWNETWIARYVVLVFKLVRLSFSGYNWLISTFLIKYPSNVLVFGVWGCLIIGVTVCFYLLKIFLGHWQSLKWIKLCTNTFGFVIHLNGCALPANFKMLVYLRLLCAILKRKLPPHVIISMLFLLWNGTFW